MKKEKSTRLAAISDSISFGTQYWRPPHPDPEFWERDFKAMKSMGLTIARLWIYWRWHERRPGEFQFEDTDRLFDLGDKYGIAIHPLLFLECAPEWFIRRFPETWLVTEDRVSHYPISRKSTQIGGMALCNNHPVFKDWAGRFLREFVGRYRARRNLVCWDVWNELQTKTAEFVCVCGHCRHEFGVDMRKKYGTLDALNSAWHTCFGTWEDVEPPSEASNYAPWNAWRRWQARSLGRQAQWRAETIRAVAPEQVVMIHMPTELDMPGRGCGDWATGTAGMDFAGNSSHIQRSHRGGGTLSERLSARGLLAATHDITVQRSPGFGWACEVSSDTASYYPPPAIHPDDIAYWTWKPLSMGLRGVLFWQFRGETYGPESPGLGLVEMNTSKTKRASVVRKITETVQRNRALFEKARPPKPRVGILLSIEQHMACTTLYTKIDGGRPFYHQCVLGFYNMFRKAGIPVSFVDSSSLDRNIRLLVVPRSPIADPELKKSLLAFVRNGGTAVVEAGFMTADGESFMMQENTPGLGCDADFGLHEDRVVSTRWYGLSTSLKEGSSRSEQEIVDTWLDESVSGREAGSLDSLASELRLAIDWHGKTYRTSAGFDRSSLVASGAKVIGRYDSGEPAVAERKMGKGRVIYVGTASSYTDNLYGGGYGRFLLRMASDLGIRAPLPIKPAPGVTWRVLSAGRKKLLFVFNHLEKTAQLDLGNLAQRAEILYGAKNLLKKNILRCPAMGVLVIALER